MACCITMHRNSISPECPSSASSPHEDTASSCPPNIRRKRRSRLQCLQAIYDSVPHRSRLQLYGDEVDSYRSLVDVQEQTCRTRTSEMYQLIGMFAAFQGVIYSAVSQSTVLGCGNLWSPVSLSVTACAATVVAVIRKRASIGYLREGIRANKERIEALYGQMELMKLKGMDFDFGKEPDRGMRASEGRGERYAFSVTTSIALLIILVSFTVAIVVSCEKVLCRECRCPKT